MERRGKQWRRDQHRLEAWRAIWSRRVLPRRTRSPSEFPCISSSRMRSCVERLASPAPTPPFCMPPRTPPKFSKLLQSRHIFPFSNLLLSLPLTLYCICQILITTNTYIFVSIYNIYLERGRGRVSESVKQNERGKACQKKWLDEVRQLLEALLGTVELRSWTGLESQPFDEESERLLNNDTFIFWFVFILVMWSTEKKTFFFFFVFLGPYKNILFGNKRHGLFLLFYYTNDNVIDVYY